MDTAHCISLIDYVVMLCLVNCHRDTINTEYLLCVVPCLRGIIE